MLEHGKVTDKDSQDALYFERKKRTERMYQNILGFRYTNSIMFFLPSINLFSMWWFNLPEYQST